MRLLMLTMLLACTRPKPLAVIENKVAIDPDPPKPHESWWDYCERIGRTPRYIEWRTPDFGIIVYGC